MLNEKKLDLKREQQIILITTTQRGIQWNERTPHRNRAEQTKNEMSNAVQSVSQSTTQVLILFILFLMLKIIATIKLMIKRSNKRCKVLSVKCYTPRR